MAGTVGSRLTVQPVRAPAAQQRETVGARQPEVEQHRVVGLGQGALVRLPAVGRAIDRVAGLAQRRGQLLGERRFVFDDEDPHSSHL